MNTDTQNERQGQKALKPCPFCGNTSMAQGDEFCYHWIRCRVCAAGISSPHQNNAIAAWNKRSSPAFDDLLEAAQFLFGAIESGELVRDISRDAQADWGQRMMHFTVNLGKAQAAIMKATQE